MSIWLSFNFWFILISLSLCVLLSLTLSFCCNVFIGLSLFSPLSLSVILCSVHLYLSLGRSPECDPAQTSKACLSQPFHCPLIRLSLARSPRLHLGYDCSPTAFLLVSGGLLSPPGKMASRALVKSTSLLVHVVCLQKKRKLEPALLSPFSGARSTSSYCQNDWQCSERTACPTVCCMKCRNPVNVLNLGERVLSASKGQRLRLSKDREFGGVGEVSL